MIKKSFVLAIILLMVVPVIFQIPLKARESKLKMIYVDNDGSADFTCIQDAIDYADEGDTIFVYSGIYYENVIIDKPINLVGEDKNTTIVDGSGFSDIIIKIESSNVKISKLTLQNSDQSSFAQAIHIYNLEKDSSNYEISDCIIKNNGKGIYLKNVSNISISKCDICWNIAQSIMGRNVKNIEIENCTINNNGIELDNNWVIEGGIDFGIGNFSDIKIVDCNIFENIANGIHIVDTKNILIRKNEIRNNSYNGISVISVNNMSVNNNNITMNYYWGIDLNDLSGENRQNIEICHNNILNNGIGYFSYSGGIHIEDCNNCITIANNNISYNDPTGLFFLRSESNNIFQNNFIENECNVFFVKRNSFEKNCFNENYWDRSRLLPYPILGLALFGIVPIPWINFDWCPAKEFNEIFL